MSVLSDKWIRKMSKEKKMISPFEEKQVRGNCISYGLSSFGDKAVTTGAGTGNFKNNDATTVGLKLAFKLP